MPKKMPESFNYLANNPEHVADPEIEEFMENEIARAPKDPELLAQRLHNNTAASPQDAGGDNQWSKRTRGPSASVLKTTKNWIFSIRLSAAIAIGMN